MSQNCFLSLHNLTKSLSIKIALIAKLVLHHIFRPVPGVTFDRKAECKRGTMGSIYRYKQILCSDFSFCICLCLKYTSTEQSYSFLKVIC